MSMLYVTIMDNIFCTLFDSNYLDKGITLYKSMQEHIPKFRLYVFAFDDKCYEILKEENYSNLIPISLHEFETEDLLRVKSKRTRVEYCWTCSPWIIKHVIDYYHEHICTYIDADMLFFSSPETIFQEMRRMKCSVIIVPHRFKDPETEREAHRKVGSYCVEFNTFVNDKNGYEALTWWADRCLEWCFYSVPGTTEWYGDQKYLNVFPEKFQGVMICKHLGIGLAPWNINLIEYAGEYNGVPIIREKNSGKRFPIIIYHFENVVYLTKHLLHSSSRTNSKTLHKAIYDPYIEKITKTRKYIENKYNYSISKEKRVVTNNLIIKIYQKYISPFRRIKHLYDLYWIK